jgi:hypothetical protein
MTVDTPKLLTPEEFTALIEVAVASHGPGVLAGHLTKRVAPGYVALSEQGRSLLAMA